MSDDLNIDAPKVYAGKFKTVEELEEGYKNSAKVFQENESLKQQLESVNKAPNEYMTPEDVSLDDHVLSEIKELARESNLSQSHFDKLVRNTQHKKQMQEKSFDEARKSIDDAQYAVLEDYVTKHYPETMHAEMLKKIVVDKDARQSAIQHRERLLNSTIAGMNKPTHGGYKVTKSDLTKLAIEADKARGRDKIPLQEKLIRLTREFTQQQQNR